MDKSTLGQDKSKIYFEIESIRLSDEEWRAHRKYRNVPVSEGRFSTRVRDCVYYFLSCGFQRHEDGKVCQLHQQLRGAFRRAKMMGLLPLKCTPTEVQFKWVSWEMLYAALTYSCCASLAVHTFLEFMSLMLTRTQEFEELLLMQMFAFMLLPYISTPIAYWMDCPATAHYYNHWVDFQQRFLQVTGSRMQLDFQPACDMMFLPCAVLGIAPLAWWSYSPPHLGLKQCVTYYLCVILCIMPQQIIWFYNHKALKVAARGIEESFQEVLSNKPSEQAVFEYKHLWLELTELVREFGPSMHRIYITYTVVVIWCVTSTLYGCLGCLLKGDWDLMSMFAVWTMGAIIPHYFVCNTAHSTPLQVKEGIQKKLRMIRPTQFSAPVKDEINAFLNVTLDPLAISLGGYFEVNRSLFHSTCATIVTYLIVLTQVDMSVKPTHA